MQDEARLLYRIAKAATGRPDGTGKDVIFPAVSEGTLADLIEEVEGDEGHGTPTEAGKPDWQGRLTEVDLRALSPLKGQHINPYGTFTLNMNERLPLA